MPPKGYLSARRKPKKQKTFLGFKVGKPPKSDYQKRVDAGATVIATRKLDSGKSLISTEKATGRVVSRAEEQQKVKAGSSKTMQGGPAGTRAIQPTVVPRKGIKPPSVLEKEKTKPSSKFGLDVAGAYKKGKGAYKGKQSIYKAKPSYIDVPPEIKRSDNLGGINRIDQIPKKPKPIIPVETLLRGVGGIKSNFSGMTLEQRKLLGKTSPKGGYRGAFQTSSVSFMGQKKKLAKVGGDFFRIKKDGKLAKDSLSGIQNKYFRNRLKTGKSKLKWSLLSGA